MSDASSDAVFASFARAIAGYYEGRPDKFSDQRQQQTIATNSVLLEERAHHLFTLLERRGVTDLSGRRVLDAGGGFGALSARFALAGARVTCVDPNARALKVARSVAQEHGLPVTTEVAGMQELPLASESFDVVVVNNSLCYIVDLDERAEAVAELHRVAAPGATLVMRDLNSWHPVEPFTRVPFLHALPRRVLSSASGRHPIVRLRSPLALRRELEAAGWDDVRVEAGSGRARGTLRLVTRYAHLTCLRPISSLTDSPGAPG